MFKLVLIKNVTLIRTLKFVLYKIHLHAIGVYNSRRKSFTFVILIFYSLWVTKIHLVLAFKEETNIMEQPKKKSRTSVVWESFQFLASKNGKYNYLKLNYINFYASVQLLNYLHNPLLVNERLHKLTKLKLLVSLFPFRENGKWTTKPMNYASNH